MGDYHQLKKQSQPRSWELRVIWGEFLGLQAQETASQGTLKEPFWAGGGEELDYIETHNKG